jgi:hypothetical protein
MSLEIKTLNAPKIYASPDQLSTVFLLFYVATMIAVISICCFGLWQWMLGPLSEIFETTDFDTEFRTVLEVVFNITSALLMSLFYGRFSTSERRANTILFSKRIAKSRVSISLQLVDLLKTPVIMATLTVQVLDLGTWEINDLKLTDDKFLLTSIPWTFTHVLECDSPLLLRPRPLKCQDCAGNFETTGALDQHMKLVHKKSLYVDFTLKGNFKIIATLTGTEPVTGADFVCRKVYDVDDVDEGLVFPEIATVELEGVVVDFSHF